MATIAKTVGDLFKPALWIAPGNYDTVKAQAVDFLAALQKVALTAGVFFAIDRWYDRVGFRNMLTICCLTDLLSVPTVRGFKFLPYAVLPETLLGIFAYASKHGLMQLTAFTENRWVGKAAPPEWALYGILTLMTVATHLFFMEKYFAYLERTGRKSHTPVYRIADSLAGPLATVVTGHTIVSVPR